MFRLDPRVKEEYIWPAANGSVCNALGGAALLIEAEDTRFRLSLKVPGLAAFVGRSRTVRRALAPALPLCRAA